MAGHFFWYDLMTTDTDAAGRFYSAVVGWSEQDSGVPGTNYTVFSVAGRGVAGMLPIPAEACAAGVRPAWMGYIAVEDVDQSAARLQREGGKLERPVVEVQG